MGKVSTRRRRGRHPDPDHQVSLNNQDIPGRIARLSKASQGDGFKPLVQPLRYASPRSVTAHRALLRFTALMQSGYVHQPPPPALAPPGEAPTLSGASCAEPSALPGMWLLGLCACALSELHWQLRCPARRAFYEDQVCCLRVDGQTFFWNFIHRLCR